MLDLLGDVTSTVSFLSTSQGVCVTQQSVCIKFHASCSPMAHTRCVNYPFEWYFVLIFCLCFVYKFIITTQNYNIFHYILESVY